MKQAIMNPTAHLSVIVVMICSFRFLLDGVSVTVFGHSLSIGHTDPLAYSSFLAPVLGVHGYIHTKTKPKVDNPDA
jgi:hypothetical protein